MKVILREDVQQLGKAGDVVEVKSGYARNFLIARNLAVRADSGQMKQLEHERKLLKDKKDKSLKQANDLAAKIAATSCTIPVQVGEEDKILNKGFDGYVAKPIEVKKLLEAISESLANRKVDGEAAG